VRNIAVENESQRGVRKKTTNNSNMFQCILVDFEIYSYYISICSMNTRKNFKSRKSNKSTRRSQKTMRGGNPEATKRMWDYVQMIAYNREEPIRQALIRHALINGANVNSKRGGTTPLHWAISEGDFNLARLLIDYEADLNSTSDSKRRTPLHNLTLGRARNIRKEKLEWLFELDFDVNAKDYKGNTPLHYAESVQLAQALVNKGADVNAKNNNEVTPLMIANKKGEAKLVRYLSQEIQKEYDIRKEQCDTLEEVHDDRRSSLSTLNDNTISKIESFILPEKYFGGKRKSKRRTKKNHK